MNLSVTALIIRRSSFLVNQDNYLIQARILAVPSTSTLFDIYLNAFITVLT